MAKVSVGLRGWRFEEDDIFDEDGNFLPWGEMPVDARRRLARLQAVVDRPCDACWLTHGNENVDRCNTASVVYGEPMAEVLLCDDHEPDFYYWFREAGGDEYAGTEAFQERFHEWFAAGNRAPEGYAGVEHVVADEAPDPETPDLEELNVELAPEEQAELDLRGLDLDDE